MSVYALLICGMFLVLSAIFYKTVSNPLVMFNLIWTVLIFVSIVNVLGIVMPSSYVYLCFTVGALIININYISLTILSNTFQRRRKIPKIKNVLNPELKMFIVVAINLVMLVYYILKAINVYQNVASYGNYELIRDYYYSNQNFSSTLEYLLVTYIFDAMIYVDDILAAMNLFEHKYSKLLTGLLITNIVLRTLISGGRMILFEFGICVIITYFSIFKYKSNSSESKKERRNRLKKVSLILIFALFIGIIITYIRRGRTLTLIYGVVVSLISNFTGSFSYFSLLDSRGKYVPMQYGRTIFSGIIDPVIMACNYFNITSIKLNQNTVGEVLSKFYNIGNRSTSFNAMPSMYYFFITDFGRILGLIIGPAVLSFYCYIVEKRKQYRGTLKSFAIYLLMMLTIVESPMTWLPFKTSFVMANIMVILFMSNQKILKGDKKNDFISNYSELQ